MVKYRLLNDRSRATLIPVAFCCNDSIFCVFLYKRYGGFIPGIRPGQNTANYLDFVLTRLTVVGAAYLAIICIIPEWLRNEFAVPFYFGGTSLLIVVTVTMDTVAQVHSHLLAHQYEGLIKKSRLRGRRG